MLLREPVTTRVLPTRRRSLGAEATGGGDSPQSLQICDEGLVLRCGQVLLDRAGHLGADAVDLGQGLAARRGKGRQGRVVLGQDARHVLTHPPNPQGEDDVLQGPLLGPLDGAQRVVDALVLAARQGQQVFPAQAVQVSGPVHQVRRHQLRHDLLSQAVNVHGATAREVTEALADLGRAEAVGAAPHRLALRPNRRGVALRARGRKTKAAVFLGRFSSTT